MLIIKSLAILSLSLLFIACQNDMQKQEPSKIFTFEGESVQASGQNQEFLFFVKHLVKGQDVYIECIVKGVSFRNSGAKVVLTIDGHKIKESKTAAFIVKGISPGTHRMTLELIKPNSNNPIAIKEFQVVIV